jgi:hypothetical protein
VSTPQKWWALFERTPKLKSAFYLAAGLGCATQYAVGEMPMPVSIHDHDRNLVKAVER